MAGRLRAYDWASTPLGRPDEWPASLRAITDLMIGSPGAMCMIWGPEQTLLYNDGYAPLLGLRHPDALGRPLAEVWPEIWSDIAPLVDKALSGEAVALEDLPLTMTRKGYPEETWWSFTYSPLRDETGAVAGMINITHDTTPRVLANRARDAALNRLDMALSAGHGVGTWDWDVAADRVVADARFADIYGVEPQLAADGAPLQEFFKVIHPDDKDRVGQEVQRTLETRAPFRSEYRLVQADGEIRWVSAEGRIVTDADGALRFPGVTFDITDRRQVEARQIALLDLDHALSHEADPAGVVRTSSRLLARALGAYRVGYGDVDPDAETFVVADDWVEPGGQSVAGRHHFRTYGSYIAQTREGLPVAIEDVRTDPRTAADPGPLLAFGVAALLDVPVMENDRMVAQILVHSATPRAWTEDDIDLARAFAERTRSVVSRRKAEEETRAAAVRQAALLELNDALRDLTDPEEIAHTSSRILAEALGVSRVGYGVMDTVAETVTIARDYNAPGIQSIAGVIHFRDFGSYIENLTRGETVIFADAAHDPRVPDGGAALAGIRATALINMPLMENGKVVALLFVNNATPREWLDEDLALVRTFAERTRGVIARRNAEAAERESEARYRALFNTMDEGFCVVELIDGPEGPLSDYIHVEANAAAAEQVGLAGVAGRRIREIAPNEADEWIDLYRTVLETGQPTRFEKEFTSTGRWLELSAFRVDPPERRQVAVLFKDLTERNRTERALRESEAQFRVFAQAVPNQIWASLPDGTLYWFNEQVYHYTGRGEGTLDGATTWGQIVHPDDLPAAGEAWAHALATGEVYQAEFRILRADGAWRWFIVRAEPVRDEAGVITRWVGANIDIEDRRQQAHELAQLNEQLKVLLAGSKAERDRLWLLSQDMLARADYGGDLSAVNPAWTRILGWSEEELLTNPYADIIDPQHLPATAAALEEMQRTGQPARFENRILTKDNVWTPVGWTVAPEPDGVNFIAVGRDLTEDKAREQALANAQEALRQSQKMEAVGQLTGGIAHDFNNLLAGISGSLELLSKRLSEGRLNGMERYIDAAQGSAQRAASLTQRLLAFSRRQTLDPRPTDVNRLINGMEDLIRRSVGPDVEVEVVGAGGLWPTRIDQSQLENALLNLCINARDAMAPDGGRLTIETSNKWLDDRAARARELPPGQYVSLCVTDTGTGMPPEVQAQAFDPFFTTKPLGQGTGLGLSMIHGFVRQSGGQVRIYSEMGKGTTMCLYLPRHQGGVEDDEVTSMTPVAEGGHGETVLVIDDEETVRMLVAEVLGEAGYTVVEAPDGPSGLDILRSDRRIDLLISDVGLPGGMNGRQVADAARETRPDLKVLFITGYAENAAVGNGLLAPGMEVLTKPFVMGDLAAKVHDMIEA